MDYINIIIFAGLAIIFSFYIVISRAPNGRLPKVPLGLFVVFSACKLSVPVFNYFDMASTAKTLDVTASIIVWMGVLRVAVYFSVDLFLRQKRGLAIPTITRDFGLAVIYVFIAMIVLKQKTNVNLGSLLTTSAILTAVIGFAMQDTLGNLFSGLALQLEHPYQIGDWIGFEGMEGKVIGITWKSTKILTRTEEMIFVPNNTIAKATLTNFSRPTPKHVTFLEIGTSYNDAPHKVRKAITETILDHPMVMKSHPPLVVVTKYDNFSINYKAFFATEDFASEGRTRFEILNDLWYRFRRDGIKIPYPIQEEWQVDPRFIEEKEREVLDEKNSQIPAMLSSLPIFKEFNAEEISALVMNVRVLDYAPGETVVSQGGESGPMYIIKNGECSVFVTHDGGTQHEVARLGPLDFFGEMSVLTGAPRAATVKAKGPVTCLEIDRDDLKGLFDSHPSLVSRITEYLIERQLGLDKHKAKTEESARFVSEKQNQLVSKIRSFLGV